LEQIKLDVRVENLKLQEELRRLEEVWYVGLVAKSYLCATAQRSLHQREGKKPRAEIISNHLLLAMPK
jgi:hypothetical protein